jgi:hypothetical protein
MICYNHAIKLLPPNGVEPVTSALLVPRSTN